MKPLLGPISTPHSRPTQIGDLLPQRLTIDRLQTDLLFPGVEQTKELWMAVSFVRELRLWLP